MQNVLDVSQLRRETPGCRQGQIFLSSAGSSLQPQCVLDRLQQYNETESLVGGYRAQDLYREEFESVYDTLASYIGASPTEIALTENATRAWQSVFSSIPFKHGDIIVTSETEYHSNYIPFLQAKQRTGIDIKVVPCNGDGEVCIEALRSMMDDRVRLVSLTHVPSNNGLVNDAAAIGAVIKEFNALFLLDACQSVGQVPINVRELHCDFLVASGRKYLRAPRGTGFLFARSGSHKNLEPAMLDGLGAEWCSPDSYTVRSDARKYEVWEKNIALFLGLGSAVRYAQRLGPTGIWDRVQDLARYTRALLADIPEITVHDTGRIQSGIVTFSIAGVEAAEAYQILAEKNIYLGYTGIRSTRLNMSRRKLDSVLRASVHYFNTRSEIERFAAILVDEFSATHRLPMRSKMQGLTSSFRPDGSHFKTNSRKTNSRRLD